MPDPMDEAKREAEAGVADDRLGKLVEALGGTASAQAVFGTPIEKDGVTIVPVASVRYGAGGGGGHRGPGPKKRESGDPNQVGYGHGGGVQAAPVGYIELRGGEARYRRIADPARPMGRCPALPARRGGLVRHRGTRLGAGCQGVASPRVGARLRQPPRRVRH
jgi:uncharacterized spore protein YtfJ